MNKLSCLRIEDIGSLFPPVIIKYYPKLLKFRRTHSTITFYNKKSSEDMKRPQSNINGFSESLCLNESHSRIFSKTK